MLVLADVLFPPADYRRTTWSLLQWWEARRLTFNIAVGTSGVVTLGLVNLISHVPPGLSGHVPWQAVVLYGVLANVFYSSGWAVESALQRLWGDKCPLLGPALFRQGLAFSVGLTLLPVAVASLGWLFHLGTLVFR